MLTLKKEDADNSLEREKRLQKKSTSSGKVDDSDEEDDYDYESALDAGSENIYGRRDDDETRAC